MGPIDLEVRESEFLTLLGPSGSGKTTTLMMIAGLQTPSSGTIEIDGQEPDESPTLPPQPDVPGLCLVPPYDGRTEHRVSAKAAPCVEISHRGTSSRGSGPAKPTLLNSNKPTTSDEFGARQCGALG
ncbi:ATP-binding cassette domain-containing protein (plasmid) [Sinorhizobium garamanticum]|uniref:ATP-binding cassette domain-containing protein n=1 Tax=Sinorhizobium garamanticum TaxID=680247 RepID=A0ABY8DLR4_9HYPH|nr:ATP-binding cassette domain-containing protein [Sinorhizobium garamanticum]WEX91809.1 ATP-binding cassette domain-containing protein [Sinorhizobium garamanticum]